MARIPTVTSKVTPFAGGIDVSASPEAFGAQIGQAKIGLGNSIGQLGSAIGSVAERFSAEAKSQQRDVDNLAVATALASPEANFDKQFNDITITSNGDALPQVSDAYMKHIDAVLAANPNMSAAAKQDLKLRMLQHAPVYNAQAADYDTVQGVKATGENIDEALDTSINSIRNGGGAETTTGLKDPKTGIVTTQSRYDIAIQKGVDLINAEKITPAMKADGIKKFKSQAAAARFDALMNGAITSKKDAPGLADAALNDFRTDPRWQKEMTRADYDATLTKLINVQDQSRKSIRARIKIQIQRLNAMGNDPSMGLAMPSMIADAKRLAQEYGDDEDNANLETIQHEWDTRDKEKFTPNSGLVKKRDEIGGKAQPITGSEGGPAGKGGAGGDVLLGGGDGDAQSFLLQRSVHRNQPYYITSMSPQLQTNLAALIQSAPPAIRDNLVIVSGARSRGDQERVLAGRAPSSTVAGLNGPHVRGVAADLGWRGGRGTHLPPEAQAWLYQNAPRFGMAISPWAAPGGASFEPWHIELMGQGGQRISGNMRGPGGGVLLGGEAGDTLSVAAAGTPVSYRPMFEATAKYDARLPAILASQARVESGFNPNARPPGGGAGEVGLMQFIPETARRWKVNPADPASSVDGAGRMMQHLLQKYAGKSKGGYDDVALALAAYNAGEGRVDMFLIGRGNIPGSTQDYIRKVVGGQGTALGASETGMGGMPSVATGGGYISWDQFVQMQTYNKMITENNQAMQEDFMSYAASKGQDISGVIDPTTGSLADDASFAQRDEDYQTAVKDHNPLVSKENPYPNPLTKEEAGAAVTIVNSHDEARQLDLMEHIATLSQPTQDAMLHQIGEDSAEGRTFAYAGAVYKRDRHLAAQIMHGHNLLANHELDYIKRIGGSEHVDDLYTAAAGDTLLGMNVEAQGVLKDAAISLFAAAAKPGTKTPNQEDMDAAFAKALGMQKTTINGGETLIPENMDPTAVTKTVQALDIEDWTKASIDGKPPMDGDTGKPMSAEDMNVAGKLVPVDTKGHYKIVMEDGRIVQSELPKNADDNGEAYIFTLTPELIKATVPDAAAAGETGAAAPPTASEVSAVPGAAPVPVDVTGYSPTGTVPAAALEPPAPPAPPGTPALPPYATTPLSSETAAAVPPEIAPAEGQSSTPFIPPYASTPTGQPPQAPPFGDPTGKPYQPQPATRAGGPGATFGPGGSGTGSGPASPRQFPSSEGMQGLDLTPQEQHLYDHHLQNITEGKTVTNPDGSTSTLYQASVPHKGKWYNIPRVWDGKILSEAQAIKRAVTEKGWNYWPSYKTQDEAEARYGAMHGELEKDVTAGENTSPQPQEQPPNPYKAPAVPISPTGMPAVAARARQSYHDSLLSVGVEEGSDEMKTLLKIFDETNTMQELNKSIKPPSFNGPR